MCTERGGHTARTPQTSVPSPVSNLSTLQMFDNTTLVQVASQVREYTKLEPQI